MGKTLLKIKSEKWSIEIGYNFRGGKYRGGGCSVWGEKIEWRVVVEKF